MRLHNMDRGAVPLWLLVLGGALGVGAAAGFALASGGVLDLVGESSGIAAPTQASYYDCPDGDRLGAFTRGDRVYLTGRDGDGVWVEVRSPLDLDFRVWVRSTHIVPDALVDLPVNDCRIPIQAVVDSSTTTTTSTIPGGDTTTTTVALPSVGAVNASADPMWEGYAADEPGGLCTGLAAQPIKSQISATVTAAAGVQSVVLEWSVGAISGSSPMALSSGAYRATLGRFDAEDPDVVPQGASLTIAVTVRVTDTLGRVATAQRTVTLNDCTFG